MIHSLCGFDRLLLAETDQQARRVIAIQNWLAFSALLLCSASAAYLFGVGTGSLASGVAVGLLVFAVLAAMQGMLMAGAGVPSDIPFDALDTWRPHRLRIWIALLIAILFSQPVILTLYANIAPAKAFSAIDDKRLLRDGFEEEFRTRQANELQNQLGVQRELLGRLNSLDPGRQNVSSLQAVLPPSQLKRKALLIGNQAYPTSPLNNPRKDVTDLNAALKEIGFSTTVLLDATQQTMEIAISRYIAALKPSDISIFYFTGHGFQDDGNNYLVPTDFSGGDRSRAVGLNAAVAAMGARTPAASVVVIDACRSFASGKKGGLALTEAGANTYLAFAAKPGQFAQDGPPGSNGKFTAALLKHIRQPDHVDQMFMDVRKDVAELTNNTQETWSAHNLRGRIYLPETNFEMKSRVSQRSNGGQSGEKLAAKVWDPQSCEARAESIGSRGAGVFLSRCVAARILKMEDDMSALTQARDAPTGPAIGGGGASSRVLTASDLRLLLQAMWANGLIAALATVATVLLLASAFLWRHREVVSLRAYENKKLQRSRSYIKETHDDIKCHLERKELKLAAWRETYLPPLRFEPPDSSRDPRLNESLVDRTRKGFDALHAFYSTAAKGGGA